MPFESLQILFYYFCLCKPAQSHVRVELMTSLKEIRRATDWDRERWWGEVWGGKKRWRTDGIFFGWEPLQFDMDLSDPVSIILVTAGSRGQKVLFRYPYQPPSKTELHEKGQFNIYCLTCGLVELADLCSFLSFEHLNQTLKETTSCKYDLYFQVDNYKSQPLMSGDKDFDSVP